MDLGWISGFWGSILVVFSGFSGFWGSVWYVLLGKSQILLRKSKILLRTSKISVDFHISKFSAPPYFKNFGPGRPPHIIMASPYPHPSISKPLVIKKTPDPGSRMSCDLMSDKQQIPRISKPLAITNPWLDQKILGMSFKRKIAGVMAKQIKEIEGITNGNNGFQKITKEIKKNRMVLQRIHLLQGKNVKNIGRGGTNQRKQLLLLLLRLLLPVC